MTKKKTKRRLRPSIKYTLIILCVVLIVFSLAKVLIKDKWDSYSSANNHAKSINNDKCLVYYPSGFKKADDVLEKLCNNKSDKDQVFDYRLTKEGSYQYISYGDLRYLVNEHYQYPEVSKLKDDDGKKVLSDYLRYAMKSEGLDYAYSVPFLEESYYKNIKDEDYKCEIKEDKLACYFNKFDVEAKIPIDNIASYVGLDIKMNENYIKPSYVDPHRKTIAITFDDGPSLSGSSEKIYEALYKYDAKATFFEIGSRLNDNSKELLTKGINYGFEYGSHGMTHSSLPVLNKDEMIKEVMGVADYFKEYLNYDVVTYRPPYGYFDENVDKNIKLPAVMWNIDSEDWESHNPKKITKIINDHLFDGAIILMHDIHDETAKTIDDYHLIRDLVNKGYQLVTITELANHNGDTLSQGTHYGW